MFSCYICNENLPNCGIAIKHLRLIHSLFDNGKLCLKCCYKNCLSSYRTFSGYRKHLLKHQSENSNLLVCDDENSHISEMGANDLSFKYDSRPISDNINEEQSHSDCEDDCTSFAKEQDGDFSVDLKLYIMQLINLSIPETKVQVLFNSLNDLLDSLFNNLINNCPDQVSSNYISEFFTKTKNQVKEYNSIYKRSKLIKAANFVRPKEIVIGMRPENVKTQGSSNYIERNIPCCFQYVPILDTIKYLLTKNKPYWNTLFCKIGNTNEKEIVIGSNLTANALFQVKKYFLQLQIFYDDFETTNPLGSKTGSHKMGAVYFTIKNFPNVLNSHLSNIHLLALFYTADFKLQNLEPISLNTILKPIIEDIRILESEGIVLDGLDEPVFGTLVSLSHDNLAANALCGMVESFQANYYCRICLLHKNTAEHCVLELQEDLRTNASFEEYGNTASEENNIFGVKRKSILNELTFFKLGDALSVDIMHDILEGCVPLELKLFLNVIVNQKKLISLTDLNQRIKLFHYGFLNNTSKPSPIVLDKPGNHIGQRAMQSWCLIRYLPLILDDILTPEVRTYFQVILLLLKIMSISFSPRISEVMVEHLKELIAKHHKLFQSEFKHHLTPKLHFLIHYPTVIKRMGPLPTLWCMRYEAKHAVLKHLVVQLKNYKNVAKTLATKLQQLTWFDNQDDLLTLEIGPYKILSFHKYVHNRIIKEKIEDFPDNTEVCIANWIKYGYHYRRHFMICTGKDCSGFPSFEEILDVMFIENQPLFLTQKYVTVQFCENFHAYKLSLNQNNIQLNVVDLKLLLYKEPYTLHQPHSGVANYLVPKHDFLF